MLNLKQYGIDITRTSVLTNDLIVLANVDRKNNIDTRVNGIGANYITIEGKHENVTGYAMIGSDLVKIVSSEIIENNTKLAIEKGQYGVKGTFTVGSHFRTVVVVDDNSDIQLLSWEFEDTTGSPSSSLFPVELGTGTINVRSELKLWSPHSTEQKYKVRNRKSIAYIFKGMGDKRVLKFTTVITKVGFNTRGKKEPNKIKLTIKTKLAQWYDKDVVINQQLKGTTPKEFFKMVFDLTDDEVYYAEGVSEESFPKINNLHTKEYSTMSELLQAYCQNGIRFCFDREEKVKIFGDFNIDGINTDRIFEYDITDFMFTEDEQMIYNTINTESYQRLTMYDFSDLDNKYVKFFKVKRNAINSNQFMTVSENGDWNVQTLSIIDEDVHSSLQLKDYVLLKRTVEPYLEFYARVIAIESGNRVILTPLLYDKDYKLLNYGKYNYLAQYLVTQSCPMDLYYVKEELPMIFKYTRNKNGEEVDSSLAMPLLPRVDGETKYQTETNITFGCASDLDVGSYTGIVEEIDGIYGTWDSSKLLYNRELTQFSNNGYPPIFALTNKLEERLTESGTPILNYTHFDNSDFLLEVERPSDNSFDAVLKMSNTKSVNSSIDLYVGKEIGRFGNKILQVEELEPYKIGDVLIVNRPDDLNAQEETEFDETLSSIRWTITAKETQVSSDGTRKHYIYVDSNFAKRQQTGKVYEFTKFPNWSVVFLQELYFRGNPVIEYTQDVVGLSKGTSIDGDTSNELYGEKTYDIDSKQLNKENLKLLMGYILEHFQATKPENTKFTIPISVYNALDVELLDVVRVKDPVYSQIQENMQWVVVSVSAKGGTNEMELTLLNVNSKNTEPYKIDIKDVIEYTPVEIPTYDHAGGEGNSESNNDGTGGTDTDKTLGQFWLSEVSSEKFRARVEKFEGNYIYFKDFNGEEYEQYQSKLFPVAEFAVNIKGEVIFVQSDMNYRAFIKKRRVYDTEEVLIAPEDDVTFLVTTTYVDIDGTFYSRKMMVGDGDSYLSVDTINGVKVVGDFVVGESSQTADNDLWSALQKNKTFQQTTAPQSTPSYVLKDGDIWYDIDDENHCYRYNGSVWVSARDGSIVSSKNTVFIQPNEPRDKDGRPLVEGDTWYDSDDGNKPYVYQGGKWVNVTDMGLQEAIEKAQQQADESTQKLEDIADDNKVTPDEKKQVSQEWEVIKGEYPKLTSEATKFGLTYSDYKLRYDTLNGYITPILSSMTSTTSINRTTFKSNFVNYYNSRQDLLNNINTKIKESAVADSRSYADMVIDSLNNDLTEQIDGKIDSYNQTTDPSLSWSTEDKEKHTGDLWYNPDKQTTFRWSGSKWEEIGAKDAVAQAIAESKRTVFTSQPVPPYKVGDLWVTNLTSSGDLKVCKVARESGSYVASDWTNATKYTDDTVANNALTNAQQAQTDANTANSLLSDIASDNKLTPNEKISTKKEWEEIQSEYSKNLTQAQLYGVSYSDYTTKYNALSSYITPLLSSMTTTSAITGSTFRAKFKDYYDSRQNLLGDIYAKIKELSISESASYADQVITELNKDLINQIDGKIDSYNQETDPSTSWTTTEEKTKHTGDLWYKPSEKLTRRWSGTAWQTLDAKDTVAQAIAQSKRRVFTSQPTIPYDAGDLWITNMTSSGDMKVCKTSRSSGSFTSTDWINATKYTDDTVANQAIQNAQNAQNSADTANGLLTDIASDNKLTAGEKQSTKKEWDTIVSEYTINVDQAKLFGVAYSDYTTKYNSLSTYITPLLSNLNTTSDIVGTTFRSKFKDYYDSRQNLLNSISTKAKELADNAQADATTALGNAKIFYQTTAPTSGMKERDLWYDTDDGNHPYVYINGKWTSARDKIFETESGNKVYFQATKPPSSGTGVKEGDMWFDTANNNTQYVLIKQSSGTLTWTLASDANDKIAKGEVVINANTTFNGDATIVSHGTDETTVIQGGSITFTRSGKPMTVIRNMKFGEIETDSNGKGVLSFPDFKNMKLLLSIKSFHISQNIRSLGCYANLLNLSENKYQFYIYGTEATIGEGTSWETAYGVMGTSYSRSEIVSLGCSSVLLTTSGSVSLGSYYIGTKATTADRVVSDFFYDSSKYPKINLKVYRVTDSEVSIVKNTTIPYNISCTKVTYQTVGSVSTVDQYYAQMSVNLNNTINIDDIYTTFNKSTLGYKFELTIERAYIGYYRNVANKATYVEESISSSSLQTKIKAYGSYNDEAIVSLTGSGTLFYLAMEE